MLQIILAILVFCVIIIIHELGHFLVAKACGIYVKEFAIGMGPVIFRKSGRETDFVLRLLPIGGACVMEGEDGGCDNAELDEQGNVIADGKPTNPRAFNRKPVWQRMLVILAGPVMNLLLGFIVVVISLCTSKAIASTTISEFQPDSLSSSVLQADDRVLAIDGMTVFTSSDIIYKLQSSDRVNEAGNLVFDFRVKRGGETLLLKDVEFTTTQKDDGSSSIYFDFYVYRLEKNFVNIVSEGFRETCSTGRLIIMSLIDILRGKYGLNEMSGPVGVVQVVSQSVSYGFSTFMSLVSLITINVGVFNLLPIPALDGCRFLFLLIEAIRRKPLKPQVEGMVHFAGFALLMLLMIFVTFNDIFRLVKGG